MYWKKIDVVYLFYGTLIMENRGGASSIWQRMQPY